MARFSKNPLAGIVRDETDITLSTLGAQTAIVAASRIDTSRLNGFRVLKTQYWIGVQGKTTAEGPVEIGAEIGLDATEVKECIEADPQNSGEAGAIEQSLRPVWPLVMIKREGTGILTWMDGQFREWKPQWSVPEGQGLFWYAFNYGGSALTSGTVVKIIAKHFGVWLRD